MGGHQREADKHVLFGHGGCDDRGDEHAGFVGQFDYGHGLEGVAHEERDDGGLGVADVETVVLECLMGVLGELPKVLDALGLLLHDVEGLAGGCHGGGRHGGAEDEGAGVVLDVDDVIERLASWNYRKDSLESSAGFEEERTGECASHIEKAILDQLDAVPVSFSYIADKLSMNGIDIAVPDLLKELFDMCGKGLITQTGSYYVKKFG